MAKFSAAKRKSLPKSSFGVPSKAKTAAGKAKSGSFPMPAGDKNHARAALRFIKNAPAGDQPKIRARANSILGKGKSSSKKK